MKRRFTDDLSDLDIQLQNLTSEVSAQEMIEELDSIASALKHSEAIIQEEGPDYSDN